MNVNLGPSRNSPEKRNSVFRCHSSPGQRRSRTPALCHGRTFSHCKLDGGQKMSQIIPQLRHPPTFTLPISCHSCFLRAFLSRMSVKDSGFGGKEEIPG